MSKPIELSSLRHTLENGVTTLVTRTPAHQRAAVAVYLKTGSRFESARENGLSHFLEHMLFRGTQQHPSAHLLATAFEDLGGTLDATTAADHGTLGINLPLETLLDALPLMATVFTEPLLRDVEIERGIIREEILEDLGEEGQIIDPATLVRTLAFSGSSLGFPITGPIENIERFSIQELRRHHEKTYVGAKTVVSVAGPVDVDAISHRLERAFSGVKPGAAPEAITPPPQAAPRARLVRHAGSPQTSVTLSYLCPGHQDRYEPALEMLMRIIDDGMATRLYHELCDKRGLCYSVSGTFEAYEDSGLVELEADTAHERAPEVLEQMLHVTSDLASSLISDAEFERTRKRARFQHEAFASEPGATADFFAIAEITQTARSPSERLEQLLSVTREDIRTAAMRVFRPQGRNVVAVGSPPARRMQSLALADT